MITFNKVCAQGDVFIKRIDSLPEGLSKDEVNDSDYIVTHSETGHHHVMPTKDADFFTAANDPFVLHVVVNNETTLRHLRSFDTHKTISFSPGIYRITRQREYTSEGFRRAID